MRRVTMLMIACALEIHLPVSRHVIRKNAGRTHGRQVTGMNARVMEEQHEALGGSSVV